MAAPVTSKPSSGSAILRAALSGLLIMSLCLGLAAPEAQAHARRHARTARHGPERIVRRGVVLDRRGLINRALLRAALRSLRAHSAQVTDRDRIAIVDLSRPSYLPRFYLLSLDDGSVLSVVTTHGRGSDPDQTGRAVRVSNVQGSLASSTGAYVTGEAFDSLTHLSRAIRLDGLDTTNSSARCRCIVIHEANRMDGQNYASQAWISAHVGNDGKGQAGRSDGCFAFSDEDFAYILPRMAPGTFIYAGPAQLPQWTPVVAPTDCCPEAALPNGSQPARRLAPAALP